VAGNRHTLTLVTARGGSYQTARKSLIPRRFRW
jgi:hypothetical protein